MSRRSTGKEYTNEASESTPTIADDVQAPIPATMCLAVMLKEHLKVLRLKNAFRKVKFPAYVPTRLKRAVKVSQLLFSLNNVYSHLHVHEMLQYYTRPAT
jgi:hypothetical protein